MGTEVVYMYPAGLGRVFALFGDPEVLAEKYAAAGATDVEFLECDGDDRRHRTVTRRRVESAIPDFASRFLSPRNAITQTEEWGPLEGGRRDGRWSVDVHGVPVGMDGAMSLEEQDGQTRYEVTVEVKVGIPLVGKKLAGFVVDDMRAKLDAEHRFALAWLEDG